ncbi:MAG: hypothetical protein SGBAC_009231 [Bacillariaceae sp.]
MLPIPNDEAMTTSTGDPAMDIEERLDALQRSFKHEIASLMAKNEELEVKNLEADIRITELQVLVERNAAKTNGDDWISMNTNAYTFLYTSATCSGPFIAGLVTCVMQYAVFSLFLLDLLNTTSIPPGVAALVRVCQIIAIIISFLVETDMLSALRAVFYREGFEEMKAAFDGFSPWKFFFANFLMGMQGMLGKVVAFFLIIFSDNVFDLLLNFTAVMFVSEVDEIVLLLCKAGFVGRNAEKMAKKIQEMKLPQGSPKGIVRHAHLVLYGLTVLAVFIIFAIIAREQDSQNSLAAFVKVQFGDEVDPTLGLFSGCYGKELNVGWDARVRYVQTKSDRGQGNFEYCLDDDLQTWVFANVEAETACNDNFELRSAEERSTSFDLLDAKGDQWLLGTGNPISGFQLGEIDPSRFEIECGNIAINGIVASKTEELCPVLTIDAEAIGFSGSHDWSRTFEMAENRDTEVVQFYQRPVFIGDSPGTEGYEILFFAGRRWVLASATKLLAAGDDPFNRTNVVSLFETSNFWLLELPAGALSYLSEDVDQGNDRGTPLGLQWYNARYAEGVGFPFADISRPVDASFRCGKCNGVTNPCLYDGICLDDGTCDCSHGASGKLCEIKPLGDGACNPFFNTAPDEYDGGDCCMASCSQPNCGVGAMNFAFGESLLRNGSYQDEAFAWLSNEIPVNSECRNEDYLIERYALVAVSTAEEAPESWISSRDHCLWSRVTCDGSRVVEFTYDGGTSGMLQGTLASEITHLRHLERLEVFVNNFTEGTIPSEISELTALTALIFQVNRRTGTIPSEMFQLTALQELTMAGNFLSGTVPTEVGLLSALTTLTLFGNAFSGSIPSEVGKLSKLQTFDLSNNALSGSLPLEVGYLSALTVLNIFNNTDLWGSMPTEIGNLSALTRLELNSNALSGTIPSEVGELSALTDLFLHNNAMAGTMPSEVGNLSALVSLDLGVNALSGTLPSEVGQLMSLTILLLNNNALSGTVPLELGNLGALTSLFLNSNALSGTVPSEFSNMRSLKSIDLTNNSLSGTIPSEVSILSGLTLVSMANNVLSGTIPLEIGSLFALTAVYLNNNALNGTVPSEIGNLRALTKLSLYSNRLSGTIPSQIGYLSALTTLWLYDNTLSGIIPSEVGNLSVLAELDIDSNAISGSLPSEVGNISTLTWLSVPGNGLSGSLPTEVGNLGALTTLYLHNNALTGTIPSDVGNLTSLVQLSLFTNALSGAIPLEIGNLSALGLLTVSGNAMSGAIPSEIGSLSALAILNLQDNVFSGSLPSEVGSLSALGWLYLSGNAFFGNIPSEVGNLSGLSSLWLFNNALSGTIPSEIGKLTSLTELYLNSNALSGSLPSEVGNLSSLSWLYLYGNAISGSLPSEIGKLSSLISLWLYNSALSGTIPSEIGSSKAMASLQLNDNAFSGTLPVEVGKLSGLRDLYLHNNAISGSIPSEVGNLNAVTTLHLYNNALSGSIPSEIGNLSSLGALGLHGNALVGALPTEIGLLNGLVYLNVRDNNLDETLPSEIGLLTNLQYLIADGNQLSGPLPTEILQLTNLIHLELSGNRFNEDLSFYPCEETIVEMTLTTDLYPSSTAWIVTTAENGSVVASGDGYSFASFSHKLMLCIPSDGCNFTVFDQYYQDGGPTVEITRLGKLYQIDGALFTDNKVDVDICA